MHSELADSERRAAAKATLRGLMAWLGEAGIAAILTTPALSSVVDQHAAAVRDTLGDPTGGPSAVALAGYACGVRDTAIEYGWLMPDPRVAGSLPTSWPTLRLLGVCSLAREQGWA